MLLFPHLVDNIRLTKKHVRKQSIICTNHKIRCEECGKFDGLLTCKFIQLVANVHSAVPAEGLADDSLVECAIVEVFSALDDCLLYERIDPDVRALCECECSLAMYIGRPKGLESQETVSSPCCRCCNCTRRFSLHPR